MYIYIILYVYYLYIYIIYMCIYIIGGGGGAWGLGGVGRLDVSARVRVYSMGKLLTLLSLLPRLAAP